MFLNTFYKLMCVRNMQNISLYASFFVAYRLLKYDFEL